MIKIKFTVLGKDWTIRVLKKKKYNKKNGVDSLAITETIKRRIDISPKGINNETIVHELVHAYMAEMCTSSTTEMSLDDQEEIFAELTALRGREILDLSDRLLTQVNAALKPPITFVHNTKAKIK